MLLAVALLVWDERWERAHIRQDMPGFPPSFIPLAAINFPLAMFRTLMSPYFPFLWGRWGDVALVIAIGVFWYWVSLNIESWHQSRRVFMFSWKPLRLAGDTMAVGVGAIWPVVFVLRSLAPPPVSPTEWLLDLPALLWFCVADSLVWTRLRAVPFDAKRDSGDRQIDVISR